MTLLTDIVVAWCVVWGGTFIALAALGLLRMPDVYCRLHASSKAGTLGIACLAMGVVVHFQESTVAFRAIAFGLVLFLTAPISAHLIARAAFVSKATVAEAVVDDTR